MRAAAQIEPVQPTEALFERYHIGWEARDPDLIASLHSADTIFLLHDGSEAIAGRDALRAHCRELFAAYDFSLARERLLFGADHWVFEWTMILPLAEAGGTSFVARIGMLDVVTLNDAGEVVRKDVYPNGKQMAAAFARAGIDR